MPGETEPKVRPIFRTELDVSIRSLFLRSRSAQALSLAVLSCSSLLFTNPNRTRRPFDLPRAARDPCYRRRRPHSKPSNFAAGKALKPQLNISFRLKSYNRSEMKLAPYLLYGVLSLFLREDLSSSSLASERRW
ncbi:hypothetical protein KFK09_020197 [Dendrobium nobile]|uniref:Uncharacterized protein n=1 Tax=Dendrobium nobile TaxID=94219 RepID=A0A8T3ATB6_DENNO|nr:hypothetical protein KFK09_020197 [Dendrobium nobile]